MPALAEHRELVGFFSYSREDDVDSKGALSALRDRIQRELRGQLGRSARDFRLWQDKEAIAPGKLWESEINAAVAQSVFFIPIITPTSVRSPFCQFEFESFLAREQALGRNDLVFPILYIRVPGLEDDARSQDEPVLSMIARRQYVDWREFRHRDVYATQVSEAVERLCSKIAEALTRPDPSEVAERQRRQDEIDLQRRREGERQRQERTRRAAEAERQRQDEALQRQQEERRRRQERAPTNGGADRKSVVEERQRERSSLADRATTVAAVIAANMAAAERAVRGAMQTRSRGAARLASGLVARVAAQPSALGGVLRPRVAEPSRWPRSSPRWGPSGWVPCSGFRSTTRRPPRPLGR